MQQLGTPAGQHNMRSLSAPPRPLTVQHQRRRAAGGGGRGGADGQHGIHHGFLWVQPEGEVGIRDCEERRAVVSQPPGRALLITVLVLVAAAAARRRIRGRHRLRPPVWQRVGRIDRLGRRS